MRWLRARAAAQVILRILTAAGAFFILTLTTTSEEFCLALTACLVPYRYAFAVALTFRHLPLARDQLRMIREAQQLRGLWLAPTRGSLRSWLAWVRTSVGLVVPALVMTTRRAWEMTEAASARGFDAPGRRPWRALRLRASDVAVALASVAFVACLFRFMP